MQMTHDELLARLDNQIENSKVIGCECPACDNAVALRAVVELHRPIIHALPDETCWACQDLYPCPTIQAIEKELG
jgi:hypothetical protein